MKSVLISLQEDEAGAPGAAEERRQERHPAVRRAHLRPLPEAAGQAVELGRRVPRLQPPHLQPLPRGRVGGRVAVHRLLRLQVQ